MSKKEILEKLKGDIIELEDEKVNRLLKEGLEAGLSPMEIITDGLSPGLTIIGEGFAKAERFMSELVLSGEIMNDAMKILLPVMEKGGRQLGDTMVIGTVEGDLHTVGKRVVAALFTGAGYKVVDVGENVPASEFAKAAKKLKATVVGASAVLSAVKAECKVINDALVDAGIRDDVIYIVGGMDMTQHWSDISGADCWGKDGLEGVHKVKMIRAGELPKLKERLRK